MNISSHDARRIAMDALVDQRTVARYIEGRPMRFTTAERIRIAIERLGKSTAANSAVGGLEEKPIRESRLTPLMDLLAEPAQDRWHPASRVRKFNGELYVRVADVMDLIK